MEDVKRALRTIFYNSAAARMIIGALSVVTGRTRPLGVFHLLSYVDEKAQGPLQRPEALLLNALTQVVAPRVIVEFGFYKGHSSHNFLEALRASAQLYSYDVADHAAETAAKFQRPNFRFFHKSQDQFAPEDIDHQQVDLVFFDAVHDLALNQKTWHQIEPSLSDQCLVVVHDTGSWSREHALAVHDESELDPARWLSPTEYQHQPGEREFVNWIVDEYQAYGAIHLHTLTTRRHGMTVLQKRKRLQTAPARHPARHEQ
jgi:hypothetical protein